MYFLNIFFIFVTLYLDDRAATEVVLGSECVPVHTEFRLFLVTPSADITPPPELASALRLVLFDISVEGVESFMRRALVWSQRCVGTDCYCQQ